MQSGTNPDNSPTTRLILMTLLACDSPALVETILTMFSVTPSSCILCGQSSRPIVDSFAVWFQLNLRPRSFSLIDVITYLASVLAGRHLSLSNLGPWQLIIERATCGSWHSLVQSMSHRRNFPQSG